MEFKELTVIIVTFKSDNIISKCLNAISKDIKVIIVENSNNINFKKNIEEKYPNVNCILSGENKGYGSANNIGLRKVRTKYALVLNPDSTLTKNSIKNFFITASKIKDFWLIGPMNNQSVNKLDFVSGNTIEVNTLKGFAIFFNMEKFDNNFFDENFFLYFEEIDLCKRIIKKNGKILLDKNVIIEHEGSGSVEKKNTLELEKKRNWHWMWSTFYFQKKHYGFLFAIFIILPKFFSSIIKSIFYTFVFDKEKKEIYYYRLKGILNSIFGKKSWYRPSLD